MHRIPQGAIYRIYSHLSDRQQIYENGIACIRILAAYNILQRFPRLAASQQFRDFFSGLFSQLNTQHYFPNIIFVNYHPMQNSFSEQSTQNRINLAFAMISPGNSYYSKQNVEKAISVAKDNYQDFLLFVPELLSQHNYKALGYTPEEATKACVKRCKILKKHCSEFPQKLFGQREFYCREDFEEELNKVLQLYNICQEFRSDIENMTQGALENKMKSAQNDKTIVNLTEGCYYMIKELAILMTLGRTEQVTAIYHQNWRVYEKFIEGVYDQQPKKNLKFALYSQHRGQ